MKKGHKTKPVPPVAFLRQRLVHRRGCLQRLRDAGAGAREGRAVDFAGRAAVHSNAHGCTGSTDAAVDPAVLLVGDVPGDVRILLVKLSVGFLEPVLVRLEKAIFLYPTTLM